MNDAQKISISLENNTDNLDSVSFENAARMTISLLNKADYPHAAHICEHLIRRAPGRAEGYYLLGLTALNKKETISGIDLLERAHNIDPNCREYADALAAVYTQVGRLADSVYFAKLATTLEGHPTIPGLLPDELTDYFKHLFHARPTGFLVRALHKYSEKNLDVCIQLCEDELRTNQRNGEAYLLLGKCYIETGHYEKAIDALRAALHLLPDTVDAYTYMGNALIHMGEYDEAYAIHQKGVEMAPSDPDAHAALISGMKHLSSDAWETFPERVAAFPPIGEQDSLTAARGEARSDKKIRVGYLSEFFHDCDEALLLAPLIKLHDKKRFEVYCFHQSNFTDTTSSTFKRYAHDWMNIHDIDDLTTDLILRGHELDILVDLSGFGPGQRRHVFERRPALVNFSWLGLPEAAGMAGIDWILSDPETKSVDQAMALEAQNIAVLSGGLMAIAPFHFPPAEADTPAQSNGHITFGATGDLALISPETVLLWSEILKKIDGARLVLGNVPVFDPGYEANLRTLFDAEGCGDRLIFQPLPADDPVAAGTRIPFFSTIDIMLDAVPVSDPYNICRALWNGVPAITLAGDRRAATMGASVMKAADQEQWIARTRTDYIDLASSLASDFDLLSKTRSNLIAKVPKTNLFQPKKLVDQIESIYTTAVQKARSAGDPA